jgi:hypothetical protein
MGLFKTLTSAAVGAIVGATVPVRVWSTKLLAEELRAHGVNPSTLSDECLQALADDAVQSEELMARLVAGKPSTQQIIAALEAQAVFIANYVHNGAEDPMSVPSTLLAVLKRFDAPRGV